MAGPYGMIGPSSLFSEAFFCCMVAGISGGGGAKGACLPVPIPGIGLPSMGGGPGSLGGMARPPGPERDGGRLGKRPDFGPKFGEAPSEAAAAAILWRYSII